MSCSIGSCFSKAGYERSPSQAGVSVVVLEKDKLGSGATGATTAFLTQYIDTQIQDLLAMFGRAKTKVILGAHTTAIDQIEEIIEKRKIDCEFRRCPLYVYPTDESDWQNLRQEQAAGEAVGIQGKLVRDKRLPFSHFGYLETANQGKFHPRKYLAGLVEALHQAGVPIYEETEAQELSGVDPVRVLTGEYEVRARRVLVGTYAPFNRKLFFKKAMYTSYVYEARLPANSLPEGIYEDTADPYHYFRVDQLPGHDRLIVGGEDHRSDVPIKSQKNFQALRDYISRTLAAIPYQLVRRWQGPIVESVDGLAWIGPLNGSNIFYATGFSGNGMTYSMIAAQAFADWVLRRPNEAAPVYAAKRWPTLRALVHKGRDYSRIMAGGAIRNSFTWRA